MIGLSLQKQVVGIVKKAKALLREKKVTFKTYNATSDKVFEKTDKMTKGYHYFPMIFKKGKFVGGYTELEKESDSDYKCISIYL